MNDTPLCVFIDALERHKARKAKAILEANLEAKDETRKKEKTKWQSQSSVTSTEISKH